MSKDIEKLLDKYQIKNYTINEDTVDVDGDVFLFSEDLDKLPIKFGKVTGNFLCWNNKLKNLYGAPKYVGKSFACFSNLLESLEGGPEYVGDSYWCYDNQLENLIGSPEEVGGVYNFRDNKITSTEGAPKTVGLDIYSYNNEMTLVQLISQLNDNNVQVGGYIYNSHDPRHKTRVI